MPTVSIIMPTYNGAAFIEGAIESVLQQSYQDWELLIVSDGSRDNTAALVRPYTIDHSNILLIENEHNIGIQKTLNKGITLAKGKYIARLDDDDRWIDEHKLVLQCSYLDAHPGCALVGTNAVLVNVEGRTISKNSMPKTDSQIRNRLLSKNCFLHATVMFRKDASDSVGSYSESSETLHAEDYDLWLRLGQKGTLANLAMVSTALTVHDNSLTNKNRVQQARHMLAVMKKNRQAYPNYWIGWCVSYARYRGFQVIQWLPFSKPLFYFIQRLYKKI